MRNLLGRLNARTTEDLGQIAETWQFPLSSRDRLAQISQLYRTMTKPPIVRAQWDVLDPLAKSILQYLIKSGESGETVDSIAEGLAQPPNVVSVIVAELYAAGMLAYDGTASSLPIGESPSVFVPIELATTIQKVADEIERGDVSDHPFSELIQERTERELFDAAVHWGIEVVPGVTTRDELIVRLTQAIASGASRSALVDKLGHEVRGVWDKLQAVPFGTPVAVDGLIGIGNERTVFSRRNAINELEDRLLAWPTVIDGSTRALFVPQEVALTATGGMTSVAQPRPISVIGSDAPFRPVSPLAWDLMVIIQRLFGPHTPTGLDPLALSRSSALELNRMIWNSGPETPPTSYIEMLIEFATQLGLLTEPDDGVEQFERTSAVREWRLNPWLTQNARIRSVWMNSPNWVEGQNRQDIEPWNVDWQAYRVKLLHHLATLEPNKWFRVSEVAEWISEYDPGILGRDATVAMSHVGAGNDRSEHRRSVAFLVSHSISTILTWIGLIRLHDAGRDEHLFLVSDELRKVMNAKAGELVPIAGPAEISVGDDLTVHLVNPEPVQVWSVLAFADTLSLGQESVFVITAESIRSAVAAGYKPEHVVQFLTRQPGSRVPADLAERIVMLSEGADGFDLSTALAIDTSGSERADAARAILENDGYVISQVGRRLYVSVGTQRAVNVDIERIHARLVATGLGTVTNRTRG